MSFYLGIDLGTSGVKATLIDREQSVVATGRARLDVVRPEPGWSEQEPADWIAATQRAVGEIRAASERKLASVEGIGLSGQMHGATLLDERDRPLRRSILWNDARAHKEAAELDRDPAFRQITGNIVFPGFTAPKLVWVRRNERPVFDRVRRVLLPKDYLRLWLTGEYVSDRSDASGTSWLDTAARAWSEALLNATGLDVRQMPALVEGTEATGTLRPALAERWGMHRKVVVAGGAGDNAAAACGIGVASDGQAFVSLGTSGVLFAANDRYSPNPDGAVHAFCHALPGTWHQMGVILSATDSLEWLASLTRRTAAELTAALGEDLKPPTGITFLPYLSGERTPHNDAAVRGIFAGLGRASGRQDLTQAVLEGVAFALRESLDALRATGTQIVRVTAVGGGSRSHYWLRALATALDLPVDLPDGGDFGASFGAARLGLIAATGADPIEICAAPANARTITPSAGLREDYETAYAAFRALYPAARAHASRTAVGDGWG